MKKILILILLALFLLGCSPQKRFKRLVHNHPELVDTNIVHDTTIIEGWKYDTIVKVGETDTVIITKNGTTVTLYKTLYDSIFVEVEAKTDTIYKDIPCPQVSIEEEKSNEYALYIKIGLILIFVCIIMFELYNLFK